MSRRRNREVSTIEEPSEDISDSGLIFNFENELNDMRLIIDKSINSIIQTGADLSESGNYTESQDFSTVLKGLLRVKEEVLRDSGLLKEFERKLVEEDGIEVAARLLETGIESGIGLKWPRVAEIQEYNELTWECGPGFGNRKNYPIIENENVNSDGDDDDDELMMQTRDSLVCPISQGLLQEPMKNGTCGHTYSSAMIDGLFGSHQVSAIPCPVSGCRATVMRRNLVRDGKLERKLERIVERIYK